MSILQPKPDKRTKFDDVLLAYYPRLIEWALQLTRRDRSQAEDLVQELFLRFARLNTAPEQIENMESYLFLVLRNLYYSHLRRARTSAIDGLAIVGEESLDHILRALEHNELVTVRADLERICDYFCERKNTSRSASVLLLRFFLGYFPSEVMRLLQTSGIAVRKAIQTARREARRELNGNSTFRRAATTDSKPAAARLTDDPQQVFLVLRARVFASCAGECFPPAFLKQQYADPDDGLTTEELAHLVSCRDCLDRANALLGLPLLNERCPVDTIGRDTPQGPDGGTSSSGKPTVISSRDKRTKEDLDQVRRRTEQRFQEAMEHRPERLFIVVDGDVRASQTVTAPLSELKIELGRRDKPAYIEVLSEQNICIAFLLVEAPNLERSLDQVQETQLSEGRSIRVVMSFASESPTVEVIYSDPLVDPEFEREEAGVSAVPRDTDRASGNHAISFLPARRRFAAVCQWIRSWLLSISTTMNPVLASAMLFALCSIVCFVWWTRGGPRISAGTLLNRAEQSDVAVVQSARSEVIYQKVRITTSGHVVERAIYRDPQKKRRPRQQHLSSGDQQLKDSLSIAGVNWDEPLSAANYREWHDRQQVKQDIVTRKGSDLITLTTSTEEDGEVLKESLTVRESDFHPVDRTIELRDEGTVEIAELNSAAVPWGAINQDWFEPLVGQVVSDMPVHAAMHLPHVLSDLKLDEAELAARFALNQLHADAGERIRVTRTPSGIEIRGVVDTNTRKRELLSHLALVPNVRPSILSTEDIESRPLAQSSMQTGQPIKVYSVEAEPSPLEKYLRDKNLHVDQLATITHNILNGSLKVGQAEGYLFELQPRFKDASRLSSESQNQLSTLFNSYIATMEAALEANKHTLSALGFDNVNDASASTETNSPEEDIAKQIRHYQELCQALITDKTGQSQSAEAIAKEITDADQRIRLHLAKLSAPVPEKQD